MNRFAVELTETALAAITAQAHYLALEAQAPQVAQRWLERIWDAVASLEQWPRKTALAEEDAYVEYEVRQLVVGRHLLLFTVDEARRRIWIIGLRHGYRLPRPGELPQNPAARGSEREDGPRRR